MTLYLNTNNFKKCKKCQLEKIISEFGTRQRKMRNGTIKQYLCIYCKLCVCSKMKLLRTINPEIIKKHNTGALAHNRKNKWLEKNKDKRKEYERQYYLNNREKFKKVSKTEKFKQKKRMYKKNRRKNDPIFKMRENISNAILKALKKGKSNKAGKSILQYLSYNIEELKKHLEKQFNSDMNWINYGKFWHIDHIVPQSDLPYTSMEDNNFKICWSLNNLRPLEALQNIRDGAKRIRHKNKKICE